MGNWPHGFAGHIQVDEVVQAKLMVIFIGSIIMGILLSNLATKLGKSMCCSLLILYSFDEFSSWFVSVFFKLVVTCFGLSCLMSIC